MNKVFILGRLGSAPEAKATSKSTVCNFNIATSEKRKDANGEMIEKTQWHKIVAWGKTAELCGKYLDKGSQALVEGKLETRQWEDKEGNKRYTTEVVASNVQFLSPKKEKESNGFDDFGGPANQEIPF